MQTFRIDEVTTAISQMLPTKSPCPDGMPPIFFQKYWHIVELDVVDCVFSFLNRAQFPIKFNYTHIVLIPKCETAESMYEFCLISLCNVIYKIISKILANCLKYVLPSVISDSQSAFLLGRLITNNVLVAFEINYFLKCKNWGKMGYASLKLDMNKAYDRVGWVFLEKMVIKLGFDHK